MIVRRLYLSAKPHTLSWYVCFYFNLFEIYHLALWPVRRQSWHSACNWGRRDAGSSIFSSTMSGTNRSVADGIWRNSTATMRANTLTPWTPRLDHEVPRRTTAGIKRLHPPSNFGIRRLGSDGLGRVPSDVWRPFDIIRLWCWWSCRWLVGEMGFFYFSEGRATISIGVGWSAGVGVAGMKIIFNMARISTYCDLHAPYIPFPFYLAIWSLPFLLRCPIPSLLPRCPIPSLFTLLFDPFP